MSGRGDTPYSQLLPSATHSRRATSEQPSEIHSLAQHLPSCLQLKFYRATATLKMQLQSHSNEGAGRRTSSLDKWKLLLVLAASCLTARARPRRMLSFLLQQLNSLNLRDMMVHAPWAKTRYITVDGSSELNLTQLRSRFKLENKMPTTYLSSQFV